MSKFNEATRVQMPAMVHLTRLGYSYFGKIEDILKQLDCIGFNANVGKDNSNE